MRHDLAVLLHAADPGTMAGARVKDDERPLFWSMRRPWAGQSAPVHSFTGRGSERPSSTSSTQSSAHSGFAGIVLGAVIAALAQHIEH